MLQLRLQLIAALVVLGLPAGALAHGNPPAGGLVAFDPADSNTIWLRTNFGIITSGDGGQSWRWLCAEGMGYDADITDPPLGLLGGGTVALGLAGGLSVSFDRCDFSPVPALAGHVVVDLVVADNPVSALALSTDALGVDSYAVGLWATSDGGASWAAQGSPPPSDLLALSLAVSPADPQRIYLAGRDGVAGYRPVVHRSDDGGQTWSRHLLPAPKERMAYATIADPADPDTFYVGLHEADSYFGVFRTRDGGASFEPLLEMNSVFGSFALSPDGAHIVAGGPVAGLWRSPTRDIAFEKIGDQVIRCLDWRAHGLYACGEPIVDGYLLAVSQDAGDSFTPLCDRTSPCGPPERCGGGSSIGMRCPALWLTEKEELGACPDGEVGGGAGTTGAGGAGQGGDASPGGSGGETPAASTPPSCGCRLPASAPRAEGWLALLVAACWLRRRQPSGSCASRAKTRTSAPALAKR